MSNSKLVIYKAMGIYHITDEANYNTRIQNARAIHQLKEFNSVPEIIDYYCIHFGSQIEDFMVVGNDGGIQNWYELYQYAEKHLSDMILPEIKEMVERLKKGENENAQ